MSPESRLVSDGIKRAELTRLAEERFGDMVKAVVDVIRLMEIAPSLVTD